MSIGIWLVIGAVVVVLYIWYASIVKRRNRVSEALGGIDVHLQQRHDLIRLARVAQGQHYVAGRDHSKTAV